MAKMNAILNSPVLPSCKVLTKALGKLAIIPAVIIRDIPFPTPLDEICSPNHIKKTVPPTRVITVVNLKKIPGSKTIFPYVVCIDSKPIETPYPCTAAMMTVTYLVNCKSCLLPFDPCSLRDLRYGIADCIKVMIIDDDI